MTFRSTIAAAAMLAAHPVAAQDHRFEADPIASVRENFVACDVLSQLQRVMIGSVSTQAAGHTPASIRTTRSRPANGRTRKRYRNEARRACCAKGGGHVQSSPAVAGRLCRLDRLILVVVGSS